jgi:hypothetical protein
MLSLVGLLPIKDRRERQRGFPWMTATLVVINVIIHLGVTFTVYWDAPPPEELPTGCRFILTCKFRV